MCSNMIFLVGLSHDNDLVSILTIDMMHLWSISITMVNVYVRNIMHLRSTKSGGIYGFSSSTYIFP